MFRKMNLKAKLMILFLLIGLVPFTAISIISLVKSGSALRQQAYGQLIGMKKIKKSQIERFFQERQGDLSVLIDTVKTLRQEAASKLESVQSNKKTAIEILTGQWFRDIQAQQDRSLVSRGLNTFTQALATGKQSQEYHIISEEIDEFVKLNGYDDYFIIDLKGHIVHSQAREPDFNTNILTGKYRDSGLSRAVKRALESNKATIEDFAPYAPSNGSSAAFIAAPILTDTGTRGVVALQVSLASIQAIIQDRTGLGKTGETYLVGKYNGVISFRSDLETMGNGKLKVGTDITQRATEYILTVLDGKSGLNVYSDSKQNLTMVAFQPLKIRGLNWGIITKVNLEEVIVPHVKGESNDYFGTYIKKYGYYDLFLIHPEGKVFYSVQKEAEYQTNLISGKFAGSNLGELVRTILSTRQFGIADFAPYAPAGNTPAAFIAQPILQNGTVEGIVALQLSLDAINAIMQERDGMGETGETYLVGTDYLMRSDSFLDPVHHGVAASFADPDKGRVDTEAVQMALSGKEGAKVSRDYNGHEVLSAFTRLKVGDTQWALIAEVDTKEAFAAVNSLKHYTIFIALGAAAIICLCAYFISRSITAPIIKSVEMANKMAKGDLTLEIDISLEDEIGVLVNALNAMSRNLRGMFGEIASGTTTLTTSSTGLSAISEQMSGNSDHTTESANNVAAAAEEMATNMNNVAAATEQTSANLQMVVAAAEEMTSTINEIAGNTSKGSQTTARAVETAKQVSGRVDELGKAAREIDKVTETIADISEQTNLLALNATIEAARAGEAGKGFAVVAGEIKDLAHQTALATDEISNRISGVQQNTKESVEAIQSIEEIISQINDIMTNVASAIEEQSVTTQEISDNVSQAAQGVQDVNENVNHSSAVAGEVTRDIAGVSRATGEINTGSLQVKTSADQLSGLAKELSELVGRFKI